MSLQFIMGPSGSGKSHSLYQWVTREAMEHPQKNYIVLVPEQFTMQTQRDLVMASPRKGILNIDVLGFGRLAHRIFEEVGGKQGTILDEVGKSFILRKIAGDYEGKFQVLGGNLKKTGYISEVKSVISELTQYDVSPEELEQMEEQVKKQPSLAYKIGDIRMIYEGFRQFLQDQYITGEELLDVLAKVVPQSQILRDSVIVLDGFTGFTPIQNKLLKELLGICEKVMVTVTMDERENPFVYQHPYQLFALSKQMVTSLVQLAQEQKCNVEESIYLYQQPVYRFRNNPALGFLESHLFRGKNQVFEKEQDALSISYARTPKQETEFVAQQIRRLVRQKGYQYREIAIIVSNMDVYANEMERVCDRYDIPIFMDYKRSILLNSFIEHVRSLLAMAEQSYSYEGMFRYLRSGMLDFTQEEIDVLENYVIALGIRGLGKWKTRWTRKTKHMTEEELLEINELRERVVEHIQPVAEVLAKRKKTVWEITNTLHTYFQTEMMQQKLKEQELLFLEAGELALEKEYAQVYRIMMDLFDQFVELLGDEKVTIKEYSDLLDAGLESAKVGVIPPSIDQVVVGDMERTRIKDVKAVFLMGVNDSYIPNMSGTGSLLSEFDREKLKNQGMHLAPGMKEKMMIQKFYLYLAMTKPTEYLFVSFSQSSADGKSLRPAYLIYDLKRMYPKLQEAEVEYSLAQAELTEKSGISYLVKGMRLKENPGADWKELYSWYSRHPEWKAQLEQMVEASFYQKTKETLSRETAQKLYGKILENSVSRLEKYASCAYAHFLTYGLKLQEREEYSFQAVDLGNVFHQSMEYLSKAVLLEGCQWTELTEEMMTRLVEESVEKSIADYGNSILFSSARNEYMAARLKRMLRRTVWAIQKHLEKGLFVPIGYEVNFGTIKDAKIPLGEEQFMRLRGKIDRIDVCKTEDKLYVKVVDYKTGSKSFDFAELYHGLQMQLIVYMNAVIQMQKEQHPDATVIPAGVFYQQMKDPIVEKELDDEKLEYSILKEMSLDGIVNEEEQAVNLLDTEFEKSSVVIPVTRNKNGSLSKTSKAISPEDFQVMFDYTGEQTKRIGTEIVNGNISISPYEMGTKTGCDFCPYQGICGFDEQIPGYGYRKLEKMDKEQVLKKMREEV